MTPESNPQNLTGKVAVVTGGSKGIGLATAHALVSAGASVVITGRDQAHLDAAIRSITPSSKVHTVRADVREQKDAAAAIGAAVDRFGGLDILINNAGVGVFSHVADMDPAAWRQVIETNLSGVFFCCHAAIPRLRQRGGGWIINISSLAGKNSFAGGAAYCASKAGLNAFSESLMQEVRQDDIRVSYVMPGSVATSFGAPDQGAGASGTERPASGRVVELARRGAGGPADSRDDETWKLAPEDIAQVVMDLLAHPARSLPSRVEIRPSKPVKG